MEHDCHTHQRNQRKSIEKGRRKGTNYNGRITATKKNNSGKETEREWSREKCKPTTLEDNPWLSLLPSNEQRQANDIRKKQEENIERKFEDRSFGRREN